MKISSIKYAIIYLIFFLLLDSIVHGKEYSGIKISNSCTVEIYYVYLHTIGDIKIEEVEKYATNVIIYKNADLTQDKWQSFLIGLNGYSGRNSDPIDPKWKIVIRDNSSNFIYTYYIDAWCKNGLLGGERVRFNGKIGYWIRSHLTEAFDLKKHPVWSKYAD